MAALFQMCEKLFGSRSGVVGDSGFSSASSASSRVGVGCVGVDNGTAGEVFTVCGDVVGDVCGEQGHGFGIDGVVSSGSCSRSDGKTSPVVALGDNVLSGVSLRGGVLVDADVSKGKVSRGKHYARNQRKKEKKRAMAGNWRVGKESKQEVVGIKKDELQLSLEAKWKAENELAVVKARKDKAFQEARDIDAEARSRKSGLLKVTETNKVAVEKAFSTLRAKGDSGCATVVSCDGLTDGASAESISESISPNSSASMAEFWQLQKENFDLKKENEDLKKKARFGLVEEGKSVDFTLDGDGELPSDVKELVASINKRSYMSAGVYDNARDDYELMGADMEKYVPTHLTVKAQFFT
jgi:hypothetical protein